MAKNPVTQEHVPCKHLPLLSTHSSPNLQASPIGILGSGNRQIEILYS